MKNLIYYLLVSCILLQSCADSKEVTSLDYQNTVSSSSHQNPTLVKVRFICEELECTYSRQDSLINSLKKLIEIYSYPSHLPSKIELVKRVISELEKYASSDNEIVSFISRIFSWCWLPIFYLQSQLENNPSDEGIKRDIGLLLGQLEIVRDLVFDFSEENLERALGKSRNLFKGEINRTKIKPLFSNGNVTSYFKNNIIGGTEFFRWVAEPLGPIIDEAIKILGCLNEGDLVKAGRELIAFNEKYSIEYNGEETNYSKPHEKTLYQALKKLKSAQYFKVFRLLEDKNLDRIRSLICEGNMTEYVIEGGVMARKILKPKEEREEEWDKWFKERKEEFLEKSRDNPLKRKGEKEEKEGRKKNKDLNFK